MMARYLRSAHVTFTINGIDITRSFFLNFVQATVSAFAYYLSVSAS